MHTLTTPDPAAPIEQAIAVVERDVVVVIRGSFGRDTVAVLRSEIDGVSWGQSDFSECAQAANSCQQFENA